MNEPHDGSVAQVGDHTLTVRLATETTSLVFSGDTASCANLTELAQGCDALLCESESTAAPLLEPQVHHTPEDTGRTATASKSGRLIVTHVGRFLTPEEAIDRAAREYSGRIDFASPGATFVIG